MGVFKQVSWDLKEFKPMVKVLMREFEMTECSTKNLSLISAKGVKEAKKNLQTGYPKFWRSHLLVVNEILLPGSLPLTSF